MPEALWYVLHVMTNHEKRVAHHLDVRSVENYVPLYLERSRWTDRIVTLERPLFSGYVFARFSPQARLSVISSPGVLRLLGDRQQDMIASSEIDRIRKGLAGGYVLRPHPRIAVGNHVRVLHGLFEGAEGIVSEFHQQCKVVLTLSATKQCFSLELDLADIEVLQKSVMRQPPSQNAAMRWAGV